MATSRDSRSNRSFIVFSCIGVLALALPGVWLNSGGAADFRTGLKETILSELVHVNPLPPGQIADAAYVLGGTQRSLELKYQIAAELFNKEVVKIIWVLGRPGITEFSRDLGRNLTNGEWSIRQLQQLGVPVGKVEILELDEGFFGTLSEARQVSDLVRQRGLRTLVLISQDYHSGRVDISFQKFMDSEKTEYFIHSTDETCRLYQTAIEFLKKKVYKHWLLR